MLLTSRVVREGVSVKDHAFSQPLVTRFGTGFEVCSYKLVECT